LATSPENSSLIVGDFTSSTRRKTMPKVIIRMPAELDTTARERQVLKKDFQTEIEGIIENRERLTDDEAWNVGSVSTEIILVGGKAGRRRGAKKKPAKKSAKKR
jgi:hypothetical protein